MTQQDTTSLLGVLADIATKRLENENISRIFKEQTFNRISAEGTDLEDLEIKIKNYLLRNLFGIHVDKLELAQEMLSSLSSIKNDQINNKFNQDADNFKKLFIKSDVSTCMNLSNIGHDSTKIVQAQIFSGPTSTNSLKAIMSLPTYDFKVTQDFGIEKFSSLPTDISTCTLNNNSINDNQLHDYYFDGDVVDIEFGHSLDSGIDIAKSPIKLDSIENHLVTEFVAETDPGDQACISDRKDYKRKSQASATSSFQDSKTTKKAVGNFKILSMADAKESNINPPNNSSSNLLHCYEMDKLPLSSIPIGTKFLEEPILLTVATNFSTQHETSLPATILNQSDPLNINIIVNRGEIGCDINPSTTTIVAKIKTTGKGKSYNRHGNKNRLGYHNDWWIHDHNYTIPCEALQPSSKPCDTDNFKGEAVVSTPSNIGFIVISKGSKNDDTINGNDKSVDKLNFSSKDSEGNSPRDNRGCYPKHMNLPASLIKSGKHIVMMDLSKFKEKILFKELQNKQPSDALNPPPDSMFHQSNQLQTKIMDGETNSLRVTVNYDDKIRFVKSAHTQGSLNADKVKSVAKTSSAPDLPNSEEKTLALKYIQQIRFASKRHSSKTNNSAHTSINPIDTDLPSTLNKDNLHHDNNQPLPLPIHAPFGAESSIPLDASNELTIVTDTEVDTTTDSHEMGEGTIDGSGENVVLPKKKRELSCALCPQKVFTASASLLNHYRSHAGIKPYVCTYCGHSFTRQHSLNYHILIHQNASRFACETCGRKFRHPSHFKEHLRKHTGETPYTCAQCNTSFKTRNTYKRHLKARHYMLLSVDGIRNMTPQEILNMENASTNSTLNVTD